MRSQNNRSTFANIIFVVMKLTGYVFGVGIILFVIELYTIDYIRIITFHPPERLPSIPEGAIWKGGPDGGYWYYLHGKQDSIYKIQIFIDYNGVLLKSDLYDNNLDYVICSECNKQTDTINNIIDHINSCSDGKIYLDLRDNNARVCYLELLSRKNYYLNKHR